jgi:hypothetical protein
LFVCLFVCLFCLLLLQISFKVFLFVSHCLFVGCGCKSASEVLLFFLFVGELLTAASFVLVAFHHTAAAP